VLLNVKFWWKTFCLIFRPDSVVDLDCHKKTACSIWSCFLGRAREHLVVEVMVFLKKYHFQSVEVVVWCEKLMTGFAGRGYSLVSFAKWEGLGRFVLVLLFQIKDLLGLHKIESFLSFKCLLYGPLESFSFGLLKFLRSCLPCAFYSDSIDNDIESLKRKKAKSIERMPWQ